MVKYPEMSEPESTPNIHIIVGDDDYLTESAANKIIAAAVEPSLRKTAVEIVDGRADNAESQLASLQACIASVRTPPFLDPVKLTWWRGVSFLPGGSGKSDGEKKEKLSEAVKSALEKFASQTASSPLPPNQFLIITAAKLLKTSIFAKSFSSCAQIVYFSDAGAKSKDRAASAISRLPDLAAAENLSFARNADAAFIAKTGSDTRFIVSELAKLRAYLGPDRNEITAADVAEITSVGSDEPELWDITDAVGARDVPKLMRALDRFEGKNGFGIMLATVLEKYFRSLLVVRSALDAGWLTAYGSPAKNLPPHAADNLLAAGLDGPEAKKRSWVIRRNVECARRFSAPELRAARFRMFRARESLVSSSGSANEDFVISELLRCIWQPKAAPAAPRRRI